MRNGEDRVEHKIKRSLSGLLKDDMQELQESSQQASHVNNIVDGIKHLPKQTTKWLLQKISRGLNEYGNQE